MYHNNYWYWMWKAVNSTTRHLGTLHGTLSQHIRPYTNWRWQCGSDGDGNCHEIIPGGERRHAITDHSRVADKSITKGAKRKSPGPDGLPHQFYIAAWEVIWEDLLILYNKILHNKQLFQKQALGLIFCLPTTTTPRNVQAIDQFFFLILFRNQQSEY